MCVQYLSKLSQELYEVSFAKGVREAGVEGERRILLGQDSNPAFLQKKPTAERGVYAADPSHTARLFTAEHSFLACCKGLGFKPNCLKKVLMKCFEQLKLCLLFEEMNNFPKMLSWQLNPN